MCNIYSEVLKVRVYVGGQGLLLRFVHPVVVFVTLVGSTMVIEHLRCLETCTLGYDTLTCTDVLSMHLALNCICRLASPSPGGMRWMHRKVRFWWHVPKLCVMSIRSSTHGMEFLCSRFGSNCLPCASQQIHVLRRWWRKHYMLLDSLDLCDLCIVTLSLTQTVFASCSRVRQRSYLDEGDRRLKLLVRWDTIHWTHFCDHCYTRDMF
jgi:hypothetical protein